MNSISLSAPRVGSFAPIASSTLVTSALVGLRRSSQRASVVTKPGSAICWSPRVGRIWSMVGLLLMGKGNRLERCSQRPLAGILGNVTRLNRQSR